MSSTVYSVGIDIHLTERVSAGLAVIAKNLTKTGTAADALQKHLNRIHSTFNSGMTMVGAGAALASPLIAAVKSAQTLESAMARVKIQTGATDAQMQMLSNTFDKTANVTGIFSKPALAKLSSEMYSSGISDIKQINSLLPIIAKAADVAKLMSGGKITPADTVHTLTAIAHQFGKYDTKSMTDMANATVAMSLQLPGGMKSLLGTGSTVNVPGNRMLGMDPVDLMAFQAAVAQTSGSTGSGGKGRMSAANQVNALMRSLPGMFGAGLLSGKSAFAGNVLGLSDQYGASTVMKNGKLDFFELQAKLAHSHASTSLELAQRMKAALPMLGKKAADIQPLVDRALATGGRGVDKKQIEAMLLNYMFGSAGTIATLIGDEKFINVQKKLADKARDAIKNNGIDTMQEKISNTLGFQLTRLNTNLETLSSTIGAKLIPAITPVAKQIGDIVDRVNSFAKANPQVVQAATGLVALASAALMIGGAARIAAAGFLGLKLILPIFGKALGPIGIALTAVGLLMDHWSDIMTLVRKNSDTIIVVAARMARTYDTLGETIKKVTDWIVDAIAKIGSFISKIPAFAALGNSITEAVKNLNKPPSQNEVKDAKEYMMKTGRAGIVNAVQTAGLNEQVSMGGTMGFLTTALKNNGNKKIVVNQKNTYAPVLNVAPGTDPKAIQAELEKGFHAMTRKAFQAASAGGGGNAVGRSNFEHGANGV